MPLPIVPLARQTVTVGGTDVSIRSLSRAEAMTFAEYQKGSQGLDPEKVTPFEVFVLTSGTGCTEQEAIEFRQYNSTDTVGLLIDAILTLSGLTPDADPKAPTNGPL